MSTSINSFKNVGTGKLEVVSSYEEMVETLIEDDTVDQILVQKNMDLEILKRSAENLMIFDIKIYPNKTAQGWLFKVERG